LSRPRQKVDVEQTMSTHADHRGATTMDRMTLAGSSVPRRGSYAHDMDNTKLGEWRLAISIAQHQASPMQCMARNGQCNTMFSGGRSPCGVGYPEVAAARQEEGA
jgi:hypothetical protein